MIPQSKNLMLSSLVFCSGELLSYAHAGPVAWFVGDSHYKVEDDRSSGTEYALVGLSSGAAGWHEKSKVKRKEDVVDQLKEAYTKARIHNAEPIDHVLHYDDYSWDEKAMTEGYTHGCVLALPPKSLSVWSRINEPLNDQLYFAGF